MSPKPNDNFLGYCTECYTTLTVWEYETSDHCPYCAKELLKVSYESEPLMVECPVAYCKEDIAFGSPSCPGCGTDISTSSWRKYGGVSSQDKTAKRFGPMTDDDVWSRMICCERDYQDCDCDPALDWWDLQSNNEITRSLAEQNVYMTGTNCGFCINYWQPACMELRQWLRDVLRDGVVDGAIDGCHYYVKDPSMKAPDVGEKRAARDKRDSSSEKESLEDDDFDLEIINGVAVEIMSTGVLDKPQWESF